MGDNDGGAAGRIDAGKEKRPELDAVEREVERPLVLRLCSLGRRFKVGTSAIENEYEGQNQCGYQRAENFESDSPPPARDQPLNKGSEDENSRARAGINQTKRRAAAVGKPFRDQDYVGNHSGEAKSERRHQTKKDIKLPQAVDLACQDKTQSENHGAGGDNFLDAVAVEEMADDRRDHGVNDHGQRKDRRG